MNCHQALLTHYQYERVLCVQHFVEQGALQEFAQLLALLSHQFCKESRKERIGLWIQIITGITLPLRVSQVASHITFHPTSRFARSPMLARIWTSVHAFQETPLVSAGCLKALQIMLIKSCHIFWLPMLQDPSPSAITWKLTQATVPSCYVVPSYQTAIPQIEVHCSVLRNLRSISKPSSVAMVLCPDTCCVVTWENWENSRHFQHQPLNTLPSEVGAMMGDVSMLFEMDVAETLQGTRTHKERERETHTHTHSCINTCTCIYNTYIYTY